jgi:hypothetical protein
MPFRLIWRYFELRLNLAGYREHTLSTTLYLFVVV